MVRFGVLLFLFALMFDTVACLFCVRVFVMVCAKLFSLVLMCVVLLLYAGSHFCCCQFLVPVLYRFMFASFLFCSNVAGAFVGVTRDEPRGNKQMAHSQIVIASSLILFEMDVASSIWLIILCLRWHPLAISNCRSPSFVVVCYRLQFLSS